MATRRRRGRAPAGPFFTAPSRNFREPAVTQGPDAPIPEKRPEIIAKIQKELEAKGYFLQRYSNGEFISSSIACGRSFEECRVCEVLDGAGYTIHFDPATKIYWRRGGCFD